MGRHFRHLSGMLACFTGLAIVAATSAPAIAGWGKVVSVEEHWELQVSEPDPERSAPQVTMVMSPNGNVDGVHFLFTLNHSNAPDFASGGMQVQSWQGGDFLEEHSGSDNATLNHSGETVRWAQRVTIADGNITFQVRDGSSETWGAFGGDDLSLGVSTSQSNLNSYRPAVSLSESQVSYAENRVVSLTLTKLVWVTEDGEVHEQSAPIPIDTSLDE